MSNEITDNQLLDLTFSTSGIRLAIANIEKTISEFSRTTQAKITTDLVIIKFQLGEVDKTLSKFTLQNTNGEQAEQYFKDKMKDLLHAAKELMNTTKLFKAKDN